jgi:hypothetical protein
MIKKGFRSYILIYYSLYCLCWRCSYAAIDCYLGSVDMKLRAHKCELKRRQALLPPLQTKGELTKLGSPVPRHLELQKLLKLFDE